MGGQEWSSTGLRCRMPPHNLIVGGPPARFDQVWSLALEVRSLALAHIVNLLTLLGLIAKSLTLSPLNRPRKLT